MTSHSRIFLAPGVLLLAALLASCGNHDLNAPVVPASGNTPSIPGAAATTDTTTSARGISTLGSGN
jgi:hypothetical protein